MKTVNLNNNFITTREHLNGRATPETDPNEYCSLFAIDGEEVTINAENGGVDAYTEVEEFNATTDYNQAVTVVNGGDVTINGGTYKGAYCAVYVHTGKATVENGLFFAQTDPSNNNKLLTMNCLDANYKSGTAKMVIKGGKYVGFDPAANGAESSDMSTNFVKVGYKSVNTGKTYKFTCKDIQNPLHGQTIEMPIYEVVPSSDERPGTEGTVTD